MVRANCEKLLTIVSVILLLSCQSVPQVTVNPSIDASSVPLESGAAVYVLADMREALPILELLPVKELKDKQIKQMIDRTDFAAAAMFAKESGKRFQIVTWGNYPANSVKMAFGFSKKWKKHRVKDAPYSYWHSSANGLSVALNAKQAFVLASVMPPPRMPAEPVTAPGRMTEIPGGFTEFRNNGEDAPLSCWFDDPAPFINKLLQSSGLPMEIPAQELFIKMKMASGTQTVTAAIRIQFESTPQARGVTAVLGLAKNFSQIDSNLLISKLLFANPPVQNDRNIDILTAPLGEREISLLLEMFSLY